VEIGKGLQRKIPGIDLLCLRREGVALPALPTEEHLILANGDCVPVQDLRLDDEKLYFRHKDLGGDKEVSLPLSWVVLIWRCAPDRVVSPEQFRRRLANTPRLRDRILLRNGDTLEGTVNRLGATTVEIESNNKTQTARWNQVSAISMSTELTDRRRPKGIHARLILSEMDGSPGGRVSLTSATSDGKTLQGKTAFGTRFSLPLERVAALEIHGGKGVSLMDLKPTKYEYRPYLDEQWGWSAGSNVLGRDLRLGGSVYDQGIGMHGSSLLSYSLQGKYTRFEALVGLDDRDGRKGKARVRVLLDGKAVKLGKQDTLTHASGPLRVSIDLQGARTLTLEVDNSDKGPVQNVVNWVDAHLVK
jgi:hypothetical protein